MVRGLRLGVLSGDGPRDFRPKIDLEDTSQYPSLPSKSEVKRETESRDTLQPGL